MAGWMNGQQGRHSDAVRARTTPRQYKDAPSPQPHLIQPLPSGRHLAIPIPHNDAPPASGGVGRFAKHIVINARVRFVFAISEQLSLAAWRV